MADSWREILERAAAGLSIDLKPAPPAQAQHRPNNQRTRPHPSRRSDPIAEARDLLERELKAISPQPVDERLASAGRRQTLRQRAVPRPSLLAKVDAAAPTTPAMSKRRAPKITLPEILAWRSLLGISASVIVIGLMAYALLNRGGVANETSVAQQATPASVTDGVLVSIPLPSRRPSTLQGETKR